MTFSHRQKVMLLLMIPSVFLPGTFLPPNRLRYIFSVRFDQLPTLLLSRFEHEAVVRSAGFRSHLTLQFIDVVPHGVLQLDGRKRWCILFSLLLLRFC